MPVPPSILVAEDDASWRMIYQEILEEEGYRVELAASRKEAARKLKEQSFDLAIVDLRLVDEDPHNEEGLELVERLRITDASTRIIVQSGYLTEAARGRLDELGVFAILDKEGPVQRLMKLVSQALER